jgi:TolB protein
MSEQEADELDEPDEAGKGRQVMTTAVILLILVSFLGVIFITFYNQFTGQQTLPPQLPPVAFLREAAAGTWQLFVTNAPVGDTVTQLTEETSDVLEFAVSPSGEVIAIVVARTDGGTDLKLLDWNGRTANHSRTLLECPAQNCGRLAWHPDGRRLIYERRQGNTPTLWWLDAQTGETITVLADGTAVSQAAAISADGTWLSYADLANGEMVLYEFGGGAQQRLTNGLGSTAVWHPSQPQFLFSDYDLLVYHGDENETDHQEHAHDFAETIHLYLGDSSGDWKPLLSETGNVDDANPAWSPDGKWIAFGRKPIGTTAGRQLWLMRADGGEARALTEELNVNHGPPVWSEDGRYLLFQRFDTTTPDTPPGIWLLEVSTGEMTAVTENGILPAWLPESVSSEQ